MPSSLLISLFLFFLCVFAVQLHWLCSFGGSLPAIRCDGTDNCDAADTREPSAAFAPIQRPTPSHPPTQNVNSAASRHLPASHFGGKSAQTANCAIKKRSNSPFDLCVSAVE